MLDHKSKLAFFSWSKFEKCEIAAGRLFKFEERLFVIEEGYSKSRNGILKSRNGCLKLSVDQGSSIKAIAFSVSMSL